MSDTAQITLAVIGALTLPLQALVTFWIAQRLRVNSDAVKEVTATVKETSKDIVTLKEQTNHIKDALVAVTEKEALARGIAEGRELPSIHPSPMPVPGPAGPAGRKGDTGDRGEKGATGGQGKSGSLSTSPEEDERVIGKAVLKTLEEGVSIQPLPPNKE